MHTIRIKLFIMLLWGLTAMNVGAVELTSVTVQQNRIEGQSIEVSAGVDFGDRIVELPKTNVISLPCGFGLEQSGLPRGSPLRDTVTCDKPEKSTTGLLSIVKKTTRVVTAEILSADSSPTILIAEPPLDRTIALNYSGQNYTGQFPYLPFNRYTVQVRAKEDTKTCLILIGINICLPPATTQVTRTSAPFDVLPQSGCFQFRRDPTKNPSGLDGWTVSGFFNGTDQFPPPANFSRLNVTWLDERGFLSPSATDQDGALVQNIQTSFFFPEELPSGFWRIDFLSPDLKENPEWQKVTGLTFRMLHNFASAPFLSVRPALRVNDANNIERFRRQMSGPTTELFLPFGPQPFQITLANFPLSAGDTVKQIIISVFGTLQDIPNGNRLFALDGVCPKH